MESGKAETPVAEEETVDIPGTVEPTVEIDQKPWYGEKRFDIVDEVLE